MDIIQRVRIYTRRKADGRLVFPLCVRAHLEEIMQVLPSAISEEELDRIKVGRYNQKE